MKWPWPPIRFAEVLGITSAIAIIRILAILGIGRQQTPNAGFSPDWDCVPIPKGDPICIKKIGIAK
jgi:hypothetical protein